MVGCSAINCSFYKRSGVKTRSVHKFPLNRPHLLKKWLLAVRRKNWTPSKNSILCSDHFEEKCFNRTMQIVQLRPDAVPTIFNYTKNKAGKGTIIHGEEKNTDSLSSNISKEIEDTPAEIMVDTPAEIMVDTPAEIMVDTPAEIMVDTPAEIKVEEISDEDVEFKDRQSSINLENDISESSDQSSTATNIIISSVSSAAIEHKAEHVSSSLASSQSPTHFIVSEKTLAEYKKECNEELQAKIDKSDELIQTYRNKIKILHQQNRRYRTRLANIKHSIFSQLQKREFLSSHPDFKQDQDGCLLDRKSVRICDSSETENSDVEL